MTSLREGATVVVTDGDERSALASVRALGQQGHRVYVASRLGRSLAGASRYCLGEFAVGDPMQSGDRYRAALHRLDAELLPDVILPLTEASILALLPIRANLHATIPVPPQESFERISNKAELLAHAVEAGIAVPRQIELRVPDDLSEVTARSGFPLVIKPHKSVIDAEQDKQQRVIVSYAQSPGELAERVRSMPAGSYPLLLQQRIVGPGVAVSLLIWDGEVTAAFAHRRLREKPPSGGVSVLRESIPIDPELLGQSVRLLAAFDWQGVAMVEFKIDADSGTAYLMEVNGRLWGSLQLAIDAGVNFPDLLVRSALGYQVSPITSYTVGVRTRWELGDLDHLVARLRKSARSLALPPGHRGRGAALVDFLRGFHPSIRDEVFRMSDPRPFMREATAWLRDAVRRQSQ